MNQAPTARFVPTLTEEIDPADCLTADTRLQAAPFDELAMRQSLAEAVNLAVEEMRAALLLRIDVLIAEAKSRPMSRD